MITIEEEMQMFASLTDAMRETFACKRSDYGQTTTETFRKFGPLSLYVRMHDKMGRLENLITRDSKACVVDECIEDTLLDLANYALITILEFRKDRMERYESNAGEEVYRKRC